jgi:hypothetical protein
VSSREKGQGQGEARSRTSCQDGKVMRE